jgi:hypothetical protein
LLIADAQELRSPRRVEITRTKGNLSNLGKTAVIRLDRAFPRCFRWPAGQAPSSQAKPQIAHVSGARILNEPPQAKFAFGCRRCRRKATGAPAQQQPDAAPADRRRRCGPRGAVAAAGVTAATDLERATPGAGRTFRHFSVSWTPIPEPGQLVTIWSAVNIQMVVNDSAVVWSVPGTDLTLAVLERLNAAAAK